MPYDPEIRQAYSELLQQYPWDFYSTVTFRHARTNVLNASYHLQHSLERLDCTRAFIAVEKHGSGDLHMHLLHTHAFSPQIRPESLWKYFYKAHGRSKVEDISAQSQAACAAYCSKYVLKSGYHYDFFGEKNAWLLDK